MAKQVINSSDAPEAIGPYSQAVAWNNLLFVSGQIALIPGGASLTDADIDTQTRQVLDNLTAILRAAGSGIHEVLKTTIFLTDMNDFAQVNAIYAEYFAHHPPARATIQVAGLPRGAKVEIDAIAAIP